MRGFMFSIEALMGYLILAYLISGLHLGVSSSPFSEVLLKKYSQDLIIVSSYDGTYDWIWKCLNTTGTIRDCGNVLPHIESQVTQLSENIGVIMVIDGEGHCSGLDVFCRLSEEVRASSSDVIYLSGEETTIVEFILYVK
jgi:hypothetical protein